ncbi:MAG: hypothetical protein KOO61_04700 [Spirochaetales bacterium]|nr:hypothetical protein [Spirochaetales bacterium]
MDPKSSDNSPKQRLTDLLKIASVEDLSLDDAADHCGELIDLSSDYEETAGLELAIDLLEEIIARCMASAERAQLYYLEGNAWSSLDQIADRSTESVWNWDRAKAEKALLAFRRAIKEPGFNDQPGIWRSMVYTNLGNTLDTIGRFVSSASTYASAASADPTFGMPCVNRSISLWHYAMNHYDASQKRILLWHANKQMTSALRIALEPGVDEKGRKFLSQFERVVGAKFLEAPLDLEEYSLGATEDEVLYRRWCLENCLFLNPLNDCVAESIAAQDILHLPDMVRPVGEGPGFHGFFNQIKQEYASARFFLYESLNNDEVHFSDRDVMLVDILDYASFGLASGKARWAFRSAASIMDKIAVFLAWYFGLPNSARTDFRKVWYEKGKPEKGLRTEFTSRKNWPLRGLYWLSKDLYKTSICGEDLNPEVSQFRDIRNGLEHSYVKIQEFDPPSIEGDPTRDNHAVSVGRNRFEEMALQYLQHAREAIIYLSLGINQDQRQNKPVDGGIVLPTFLPEVDDDCKF